MKKALFTVFIVFACVSVGYSEQLILQVDWEGDSFNLTSASVAEGSARPPKNGRVFSDYLCIGQDKTGAPLCVQEVALPDRFFVDNQDEEGSLRGGSTRRESGHLVVKLPYDASIQKATLYRSWSQSVSVAGLDRTGLQARTPLAEFDVQQALKSKPRLTYSDVGQAYKIRDTGPDTNRIVLAILAEGYTATEQADFLADAQETLEQLFQLPPYNEYADYVNVYAVEVFSNESGCEHPDEPVSTAFESYFTSSAGPYIPSSMFSKVYGVAAEKVPEYDTAILLVNDEAYGGASNGNLLLCTIIPDYSGELLAHELGHALYGLDDEYYHSIGGDSAANIERDTTFDLIKWNYWIEPSTSLPTEDIEANDSLVGAFGIVRNIGDPATYYRPRRTCKMKILTTKPDFCEVCQEAMLVGTVKQSVYKIVSLIEGVAPEAGVHEGSVPNYLTLSVDALQTASDTVKFHWYVDEVLVPALSGPTVLVPQALLPDGEHDIKVVVQDETARVRMDPETFMTEQVQWTFTTHSVSGVPENNWETY